MEGFWKLIVVGLARVGRELLMIRHVLGENADIFG